MDFDPINADHAIEAVAYTVVLDRLLTQSEIVAIRNSHRLWRSELPAIGPAAAMVVRVNPTTGAPDANNVQGLEFAQFRADGTPAWLLRVVGQEIVVECHRYTRWERVWGRTRQYLHQTLGCLNTEPSARVSSIGLDVLDKFQALRDDYDLCTILRHSDMLPAHVFSVGPTWHNHSGWFAQQGEDAVLNQLNVDARREPNPDKEPQMALFLCVQHVQQHRFQAPAAATNDGKQMGFLDDAAEAMHQHNKSLMQQLLTPQMKERIGL